MKSLPYSLYMQSLWSCTDRIAAEVFLVPPTNQSLPPKPLLSSSLQIDPSVHPAHPDRGPVSLPSLLSGTRQLIASNSVKLSGRTSSTHAAFQPILKAPPATYYSTPQSRESKLRTFKRYCGLCSFHFPPAACANEVLFKNIVALRSRWDPHLVPEEIVKLEQNACYLNVVYVCSFCFQFFDPTVRDKVLKEATYEVNIIDLILLRLLV